MKISQWIYRAAVTSVLACVIYYIVVIIFIALNNIIVLHLYIVN